MGKRNMEESGEPESAAMRREGAEPFAKQITPRIERYVRAIWRGHPDIEDLLQVGRITTETTIQRKMQEQVFNPDTLYAAVKARVKGALVNYLRDSGRDPNSVTLSEAIRARPLPVYVHQERRSRPFTVHLTERQREGIQQIAAKRKAAHADIIRAGVELMLAIESLQEGQEHEW